MRVTSIRRTEGVVEGVHSERPPSFQPRRAQEIIDDVLVDCGRAQSIDVFRRQVIDGPGFLEATKDRQGAAKIEVWVTLIPPSETEQWVNKSDCGRCPPDRPHPYGSATSGTYCCDNATATKVDHCDSKTPECCVAPGSVLGCQGIPRCGNNPENKTACGSGDPGLPAGTSLCSIPSDSPLTPFNESELVDLTQGYRGCNDYVPPPTNPSLEH